MLFGLIQLNQPRSYPWEMANKKETEYPGKKVEVKQKAMISFNLTLFKCLEKSACISCIWSICQEEKKSLGENIGIKVNRIF